MSLLLLLASSTSFSPSSLPNLALWLDPNPGTATGTTAGNAASFGGSAGNNLSVADNATLQTTGSDFWVAGWFSLNSLSAINYVLMKGPLGTLEYGITIDTSGGLRFRYGNGTSTNSLLSAVTISTGQWYFVAAFFNQNTLVPTIIVNNGTPDTGLSGFNPAAVANTFKIGANSTGGACNGLVDSVAFGKVTSGTVTGLISAISTSLYNGGAGKNYANLTSGEKTAWGLQSYWDLQDTTWVDSHGTNNLTQIGTVSLGTGITQVPTTFNYGCFKDGAASFPGSATNYLSTANFTGQPTEFSVSHWVYLNATQTTRCIFSNYVATNAGWATGIDDGVNNKIKFYLGGANTLTSSTALANTTWALVTVTYKAGAAKIYINGALDNSVTQSITYGTAPTVINVGGEPAAGGQYFNGRMDSLGYWTRELSAADVTALYNSGAGLGYAELSTALKTNLVSWYNLDETTGTRNDSHGSNNLTMNGTVGWAAGIASSYCGNGDPVAKWVDRSNGVVLSAPSISARPTYNTNSGKPYVQFDGVDDYLTGGSYSCLAADTICVAAAYRFVAATGVPRTQISAGANSSGAARGLIFANNSNHFTAYNSDADISPATTTDTRCTTRVLTTTSITSIVNGVTYAGILTGNPTADISAKPFYAGRLVNDVSGYLYNSRLYGAVYAKGVSDSQALQLDTYLARLMA